MDSPYTGSHVPAGVTPENGGFYPSSPQDSPIVPPDNYPEPKNKNSCPGGLYVFDYYCVEPAAGGEWSDWRHDPDYVWDPYDRITSDFSFFTDYHRGWLGRNLTVLDFAEIEWNGASHREREVYHREFLRWSCISEQVQDQDHAPSCDEENGEVLLLTTTTTITPNKGYATTHWLHGDFYVNLTGGWSTAADGRSGTYTVKTSEYEILCGDSEVSYCYCSMNIPVTTMTTSGVCGQCTDDDIPFPPKDYAHYSYSEPIVQGQLINCPTAEEIETAYIDCNTWYRCKYKDDCTERDKPFPPITNPDCTYTSAWKDSDPDADEKRYNCLFDNGWRPTGWTRLTDGTCHDTYDYTDGSIEHARIDCEDWSACKKCTYHTWNNNGNPNIPACWNWQPGDPTGGHKIYIPQPITVDPYDPGHEYPYEPPEFPPYPDFPPYDPFPDYPPYDPEDPIGPIPLNPWPPYDPNPDDPNSYQWCDCDIKKNIPDSCGCFEKPVQNSGLVCSGYVPKRYKKWIPSYSYRNSYDYYVYE